MTELQAAQERVAHLEHVIAEITGSTANEPVELGNGVRLTKLEARLYRLLLKRLEKTVRRESILAAMYQGRQDDLDCDPIYFLVHRLRRRLSDAGSPYAVLTDFGVGYRMVAL